ncbi:uncharacterized protein LOC126317519 [Schistocerca gregaria]|uniref:uncharacterized protein LOC126317519 n=1 Tax=Schistocerca gregaria TaxID=7010 RepID=UPI00211DDA4F|nr:uncharacterized protein LOC126317519 [Schistocerca gregaria]
MYTHMIDYGEHASGYIKLFVVQENGCLDVWRETEAGFVVEEATRLPISSEKIISCVITDSHIYWAEKDVDERPPNTWALFGLERRKTDRQKNFENPSAFSNTPDTNRLFDTTRVSEPLLLLEESIEELALAQENQIWIFTRDVKNRVRRLFLYSHLKTENLVDYHLPEHSLEEVHSITREVLLLDTNRGKLYAATHTNSNELTHLSNLQTSSHLTGERMHIHQHTLCLLRCSELKLYDLRSGILVQLLNLPQLASTDEFNFCKSLIPSSDCPSGVWCEKGLWQVKQPSVLKYVEFLLNSSTETPNSESTVSPQTSAALLCRDWHLKTEETVCWLKQIDLLYQKKSLNDREFHLLLQACDASFDHLESPAILISVLQKMRAKSHAKAFVERLVRHRSHMLKHLSLTTPPSFPISSLITQYLDTTDEKMISNMPLRWEDRIQQFQTEEKFNQLIKTNLQTWDLDQIVLFLSRIDARHNFGLRIMVLRLQDAVPYGRLEVGSLFTVHVEGVHEVAD